MKKTSLLLAFTWITLSAFSQQKKDTVVVELAKTSQIIFTIEDRKDIEILKHYNFNDLFQNVFKKLENQDSVSVIVKIDSIRHNPNRQEGDNEEVYWTREDNGDDDSNDERYDTDYDYGRNWDVHIGKNHWGNTWQSFNFELGTNNYLSDGKFPDADNANYSVRPWGSWYVGMSSIQRTRMGKNFFLEWGIGLNWYNFKFQDDNLLITKGDDGVMFTNDDRFDSYSKSKLTISYLTASLIPVIDFGDNSSKPRMWDGHGESFRIGIGPYVGYRIGSHSKLIYKDDGDREKDKDRSNFYLNNVRYGARLQLGYRSTDLFFNYDINELFSTGKGPKLNAFSFGVIF